MASAKVDRGDAHRFRAEGVVPRAASVDANGLGTQGDRSRPGILRVEKEDS